MTDRTPKLRELAVFRTVLRVHSVSEAARILGVSQPAVSKSLRQLEAMLGFPLFERLNGRLHPTPEAERLAPSLANVFTSVGALTESGRSIREGRLGRATVGAIPTLANVVLPAAIAAASARWHGLGVSVQILPTRQVVQAVAAGGVDMGLVHDILEDPLVTAEDLGAVAMACIVPAGHAFARRRKLDARDLRDIPFVSYPVESPIGRRMSTEFATIGMRFAPRIEVGASTALCAVALASGTLGVIEDYVMALGWWPGLRVVPLTPAIVLRPRLLVPAGRSISLAAKAVATACREETRRLLGRRNPR